METNMLNRLLTAEKRLVEIDEELSKEDITKDLKTFKELTKERSPFLGFNTTLFGI